MLSSVLGSCWQNLTTVGLKILMGPAAFYLFGPLFKLSGRIADYLLRQLQPYLGDVGLTTEGLLSWFVDVLRLQECVSSLLTFLIMGMMFGFVKKVF